MPARFHAHTLMNGRVEQVNTSPGGVPKRAVAGAEVGRLGLAGDAVKHTQIHGGPERAVCLWSLERILALQEEGHPVFPGAVGENLTLSGLDWARLGEGDLLSIGAEDGLVLRITRPTTPCKTIAPYFADRKFKRIGHDRHPGWSRWYAAVEHDGPVKPGDMVVWTAAPEVSVEAEATDPA